MTTIQIAPRHTDVKPRKHYVYIHRRMTNMEEFYVGKGSTNRGFRHSLRSDWWMRIARKNGVWVEVVQDNMTRSESLLLEMWLIAKLRHEGHVLCNMTEGGEGNFGVTPKNSRSVYCSNGMRFERVVDSITWLRDNGHPKASHSAISLCANGISRSAYGFMWSYSGISDIPETMPKAKRRTDSRYVFCSNGMMFHGVCEASAWATDGRDYSGSCIAAAAKRNSYSYGHNWSYDSVPPKPDMEEKYDARIYKMRVTKSKPIRRSDGMEYEGTSFAIEDLGLETNPMTVRNAITRCANGKRPTAYGYSWSFIDVTPEESGH